MVMEPLKDLQEPREREIKKKGMIEKSGMDGEKKQGSHGSRA